MQDLCNFDWIFGLVFGQKSGLEQREGSGFVRGDCWSRHTGTARYTGALALLYTTGTLAHSGTLVH